MQGIPVHFLNQNQSIKMANQMQVIQGQAVIPELAEGRIVHLVR